LVVAGSQTRWAVRRKIDLAELANEPWGLPASHPRAGALVRDAVHAPAISLRGAATGSPQLLLSLLAKGHFLVIIPNSVLQFGANLPPLKVLPVALGIPPWSLGIMTLKNKTVSPVAQLFLDSAREVIKPLLNKKN
jgi:DNA-binding transcriptional LysR family regulator